MLIYHDSVSKAQAVINNILKSTVFLTPTPSVHTCGNYDISSWLLSVPFFHAATKTGKAGDAPKPVKVKDVKGKEKALRAKKSVLRGAHGKRNRKVRTSVHFKRPRTYRATRDPKYPRHSTQKRPRWVKQPRSSCSCSLLSRYNRDLIVVSIRDIRSQSTRVVLTFPNF